MTRFLPIVVVGTLLLPGARSVQAQSDADQQSGGGLPGSLGGGSTGGSSGRPGAGGAGGSSSSGTAGTGGSGSTAGSQARTPDQGTGLPATLGGGAGSSSAPRGTNTAGDLTGGPSRIGYFGPRCKRSHCNEMVIQEPTTKKLPKTIYCIKEIDYSFKKPCRGCGGCCLGHFFDWLFPTGFEDCGCCRSCQGGCGRIRTRRVWLKKEQDCEEPDYKCRVVNVAPPCPCPPDGTPVGQEMPQGLPAVEQAPQPRMDAAGQPR